MNKFLVVLLFFVLIIGIECKNLKESKRADIPERVMIGYYQSWGGKKSSPFIKMRDVNENWDVINIAFAVPEQRGSTDGRMKLTINYGKDYSEAEFIEDIKQLQQKGKRILVSIGGASGYFSLLSEEAENQFVSDIKGMIDKFNLNGIDIDLEQDSLGFEVGQDPDIREIKSPKLKHMTNAIKKICSSYGPEFMLTWAPETIDIQMGYKCYAGINDCEPRFGCVLPMINALREETTFVHTQLYNSGTVLGSDGKIYTMGTREGDAAMVKMVCEGFYVGQGSGAPKSEATYFAPLRPDQVAFGVPASVNAAGSGFIANNELQAAFTEANFLYPGIRGFMAWDINIDYGENYDSFVNENRKFLDIF